MDGDGRAYFGHDPSPLAERRDETVRLAVDADQDDSSVIELPVAEVRRLLADRERDLVDFLEAAAAWAARHLPDHARSVTAAAARALDVPAPVIPSQRKATVLIEDAIALLASSGLPRRFTVQPSGMSKGLCTAVACAEKTVQP
ncbi:hypothetical protein [Streptomyces sp. NPDC020681]|uniref:hypothetical protein n=1 Tax=Streptomyces sp. NPDC020681 TaxID=3365083 RepID=UPI0037914305